MADRKEREEGACVTQQKKTKFKKKHQTIGKGEYIVQKREKEVNIFKFDHLQHPLPHIPELTNCFSLSLACTILPACTPKVM